MCLWWEVGQILRSQKTIPGALALSITIGVIIVLVLACNPEH